MNKIIDIEWVVGFDEYALIILDKTGVFYSDQCGGISCLHPKYEGYCLQVPEYDFDSVDDHSLICGVDYTKKDRNFHECAARIDSFFDSENFSFRMELKFDYSRISELKEGCWPVLVSGFLNGWDGFSIIDAPGILFTGNCD